DAVATRVCDVNGTWKFYPDHNKSWTDYSKCLSYVQEPIKPQQAFQILYSVGYILSLIALVVAMIIFLYFRKLRCPRNTIHMQFFVSFILRATFVFIRDILQANEFTYGTPFCKLAFTLTQYFLVANYYWLLVEGVYLHSLITVAVFSGKTNLRYYFALGWGCPALIVLPWAIRNIVAEEPSCWWDNVTTNNTYWIIKAPVMLSILVNFVLFLNITRVLATKLTASNAAEARVYSKLAKSTLVLIPIFGVYYIVTVGMHASADPTVTLVRMYVDLIISPFQGLFMAILYCFLNGDVQAEIQRKWKLHKINRTLSTTRSVAPRSQAHSRSSVSTPPRKDSVEDGLKNEPVRTSHRFSVIGQIIALKSRLFQKKPSKGQMNGSVSNHKDTTNGRPLTDTCSKNMTETEHLTAATEDELPKETTRLNASSSEDNRNEDMIEESKETQSDEDRLLEHNDSTTEKESTLASEEGENSQKKGVHFAANIETEV
ncbi:putative parathyroid hormone/parathyroid hormone-related peptide receptor-like, partial [Apostichopus japonicus]